MIPYNKSICNDCLYENTMCIECLRIIPWNNVYCNECQESNE